MANGLLLTPLSGTVTSAARLNIRFGQPSTRAPVAARAEPGAVLAVRGLARGEPVRGNADWYAGADDTFFWSGAVGGFQPAITNGTGPLAMPLQVHRRPNGTIRPLGDAEVRAVFGSPPYTEAGGGRVNLDPNWVAQNIVNLPTPFLADLGFPGIQVHVKARDPFARVFAAIDEAGLMERILTCAGTFVPRHKGWNPARGLSSHSWGIAIDLNVAWNGYGAVPAAVGARGCLRELVPHFEAEGFAWGGYFEPQSICDGMHFELARTNLAD
jgi:hypothetical protein